MTFSPRSGNPWGEELTAEGDGTDTVDENERAGAPSLSRANSFGGEPLMRKSRSIRAQAEKIGGYIVGNQAVWIASIGLKAGLFQAIAKGEKKRISEEGLAEVMGYDPPAVRAWCRSAYAFGFLEWKEESGYRLSPHMEELLLKPDHPAYQGGRIEFFAALNHSYRQYPQFLRSGKKDDRNGDDPWLLTALRKLTRPDAAMISDQVLPQAPRTLGRILAGGEILDIGAGEGDHVIHYARTYPRSRVLGLEPDPAKVETARGNIVEASLKGRAEMREGGVNRMEEENAYDLITLNLTLHEICPAGSCRSVLGRISRALKPEGTLLVSEIPFPDSIRSYREGPFSQLLSSVRLHLAMEGCGEVTPKQLHRWMEEGGFENVRTAAQPNPARFVVLGEKPANG